MVEFVNHAKTAYGSTVSNWTTVQITNVGVHIGTETFLYHWEGGWGVGLLNLSLIL